MSRTNPLDDPTVAHHYRVEVALADRLRNSTKAQRAELYTAVYEELFREVPYHVQLTNKDDHNHRDEMIRELMDTLAPYLTSETIYAEIGSGDCALTMQVAPLVRKAWGIDVSPTVIQGASRPTWNWSCPTVCRFRSRRLSSSPISSWSISTQRMRASSWRTFSRRCCQVDATSASRRTG